MGSKTFNLESNNHLESKIFLDESGGVSIGRYDVVKYPQILKIADRMDSLYWSPEEVDLSKDRRDFGDLTGAEKHIFTSNLKRQILLDSIQGRSPCTVFLPLVSNPETEAAISIVGMFETKHSKSYTHIIKNVYSDSTEVFDEITTIPEIIDCAKSVSHYYDDLYLWNCKMSLKTKDYSAYEHKKALWRALYAWNALEAMRFYVSFACSWAFAELKHMVGNASLVASIARDEEEHRMLTTVFIKLLPKEDEDFAKIAEELKGEVTQLYIDVMEQEKAWAKYLFKDGTMIGLNESILCDYVDWLGSARMSLVGLTSPSKGVIGSNPLPWTASWVNTKGIQLANQETENIKYLIGAISPDLGSVDYSKTFDFDRTLKKHKITS